MRNGAPFPKILLVTVGLLAWFATSIDGKNSTLLKEMKENPRVALNPLRVLGAVLARDGDDKLYYNYGRLMRGRSADLDHLAQKDQGDPKVVRARLAQIITPDGSPRLPYRDFPVEYPPVPLLLMLLPSLFVEEFSSYRFVYSGLCGVLFLLAGWLATRLAALTAVPGTPSEDRVWRRLTWLLAATGPLVCQRFDILPATLVIAAFVALANRRDVLAGLAFGVAIMTKLYPLLLLVPLAAYLVGSGERRRVVVLGAATVATVLAIAAPFLALAPEAFLRSNALYGARPFHFESMFGAIILALQGPGVVVGSFGSRNVISPAWLLQLSGVLMWTGLAAISALAWKSGRALAPEPHARRLSVLVAWTFATLVFVLCTSKVLSPQFLIWLLPLAALLPGEAGRRTFVAALVATALTQIFYPHLYGSGLSAKPLAMTILISRNLCLIVLAVLAGRWLRQHAFAGQASARLAVAPGSHVPQI